VAITNIDTFITELKAVKVALDADLAAYNNLVTYSILPADIFTVVQVSNTKKSDDNTLVINVIDALNKLKASGYPYPDVPIITPAQKTIAKNNITNLSTQLNKIINKL
jgi:hypothetical protein